MNKWQAMVEEFHSATNSVIGTTPALRENELRAKLIMEEAVETCAALGFAVDATIYKHDPRDPDGVERTKENGGDVLEMGSMFWNEVASFTKTYTEPDLLDVIDGVCDLIYVALGTVISAGIDLDPHFTEVQRANMMKLLGPKRADGKQLKPEGWQPPDHAAVLAQTENESKSWIRTRSHEQSPATLSQSSS